MAISTVEITKVICISEGFLDLAKMSKKFAIITNSFSNFFTCPFKFPDFRGVARKT